MINYMNSCIINHIFDIQLTSLELSNRNKNLDDLLMERIKLKYMNKCTNIGYINDILRIVNIGDAIISNKDLSADVNIIVNTEIVVTNQNVGDTIECTIDTLDKKIGSYMSIQSPFIIFIITTAASKHIKVGNTVKAKIVAKKIEMNEIHLIAELI